jgi:membrane protease YdiL (CAAX protease family)
MYVKGIISVFFNALGFEFASSGEPEIKNIADIIAFFVGTAIMPPLAEEFAMRNVLMQSLRKYGNLFAILASAFCFGIFHGTPNQIPFALLCGLFIGYAVTATESIWTGVIIHFIVNGISCMYYIVAYFTDEDTGDHVYYITVAVLAVLGAICGIIYSLKYKDDFKRIMAAKGPEDYKTSEKFKKFIFSPVMIIAIIIFIIEAISLIQPISEGVS